ncbi:uncharacterized protein LOC116663377 [Camelus ferus]|uniref:Uncharacterized protein LOC116663377 n=1 Tax=Camelus ferus TaxID=419612 RepID=A0A8B8SYE9_CAMFR|nr:uncharacterized protein LOC116663377 [Camelus ferus]
MAVTRRHPDTSPGPRPGLRLLSAQSPAKKLGPSLHPPVPSTPGLGRTWGGGGGHSRPRGGAGGAPGACLPGQRPLLCHHLPVHLPSLHHHAAGPGPALQKVSPRPPPGRVTWERHFSLAEAPFAPVKAGLPRGPAARGWQDIGYGCILPYSDQDGGPQDQLRNAISSILGTWLDQHSEAFCQPPDFPCLKQPVAYMQLNMPGSDLEHRAQLLLAQLEHADLTETEPEGTIWKAGMSISSVASPLSQRLMMAPAPAPGPSEDLDQPQKHQQN